MCSHLNIRLLELNTIMCNERAISRSIENPFTQYPHQRRHQRADDYRLADAYRVAHGDGAEDIYGGVVAVYLAVDIHYAGVQRGDNKLRDDDDDYRLLCAE